MPDYTPRRHLGRRLPAIFIAALLGTVLVLAFVLGMVYRQAEQEAVSEAAILVEVTEARMSSTLRRLQADLEILAASLPLEALKPGAEAPRHQAAVERLLAQHAAHFPEIMGYRAINASGMLLYYSQSGQPPVDVSDRDYFRALRDDPSLPLFFSQILIGRDNALPTLIVAVPVRGPNGNFRGVVMAALDLGHLQRIFDGAKLGPHSVVMLRRLDNGHLVFGRQLAPGGVRQDRPLPVVQQWIDSGEQAGAIRYRSQLDGIERQYAFQRVDGYPFFVAVGLAADDYLTNWRMMVAVVALFAVLMVPMLSMMLIRLLRAEREEIAISMRLGESEARYRMLADNSHDVIWMLDIAARRLSYVSPSVFGLRGYTPQEAVAQSLEQWLTPDSASRMLADIEQHLKRIATGDLSAQVMTCELEQTCRDGRSVSTEVVASYLLDRGGVPRTILGISRNISEHKEAEQALRESNRQLQLRLDEIGRLQSALQEQAVRDALTGLYNRRYLDEMLEREVSRARREGIPLALVMLDIDHFKRVNDTYGHQAGDEVLCILAATLLADIRTEDTACRYGGEELLIMLPNMPLAAAIERAEGWRRSVEALSIVHGNFPITFTISLGVAAYPEHGKTADDLMRCADRALYEAKAGGRNRTQAFTTT